ncbi:MAG: hypothetical protein AAB955_00595 [Patescibacteria group bacterium]
MREDTGKRWMVYTGAIGMAGTALYVLIAPILGEWLYSDENADCFKDGVATGRQVLNTFLFGESGDVSPYDLTPYEQEDSADECYKAYNAGYNIGITRVKEAAVAMTVSTVLLTYGLWPTRQERTVHA